MKMNKALIICTIYLALALAGMIFIKMGHSDPPLFTIPVINIGVSSKLLLGAILYGLSFMVFTLFVSNLKISTTIPVVSAIYCILVACAGVVVFKESISVGQVIGIAIVIIGTVIIGVCK